MPASVSVILPCYNGAGTLRHALTSIVKQTYADWQLILLDDNSTDDSVAIANAFHEPRFRIIEGTDTRGISHRLNDLVAEVDSEYLARMDVDDIMHPQRLQEQVAFLQSHADVDIVGSSIVTIDRLNQVRAWRCPPLRVESPLRILKGEVLYHPAIAAAPRFSSDTPIRRTTRVKISPSGPRAPTSSPSATCRRRCSSTAKKASSPFANIFLEAAIPVESCVDSVHRSSVTSTLTCWWRGAVSRTRSFFSSSRRACGIELRHSSINRCRHTTARSISVSWTASSTRAKKKQGRPRRASSSLPRGAAVLSRGPRLQRGLCRQRPGRSRVTKTADTIPGHGARKRNHRDGRQAARGPAVR